MKSASAGSQGRSATDFDRFIEQQLARTRRRVWSVDLIGALLAIVAGALVWLAAMVVVDHWLVTGGLGFRGRFVALLTLFLAIVVYGGMVVLPLILRRINPLYAAATIEHSRPGLKNSLINLLMLRGRQQELPEVVYHAIEQRAAQDLSAVPVDSVVDRSRLIMLGYMILAVVAIGALYKVLSPKDPIRSVERVLAPWAEIQAPTRVQIENIEPGDAERYYDQRLGVTAEVHGLRQEESVTLYYSTHDGQIVDRAVSMNPPDQGFRWAAELPDSGSGLQQDLEYYLRAGDATSPRYRVAVLTVPAIMVERVEYKYPAYAELPPRVTERQGDLRALEGTEVTLHAKATHDIRAAHLDFDRDGRRDLPMRVNGRTAVVRFTLKLKKASDRPEHANYQLLFTTPDGSDNPAPIEHKIEVIRDLPPEIAIVEPAAEDGATGGPPAERSLGERGTLRMAVEASDPDFRLASVKLVAERNGKALFGEELLPKARGGRFRGSFIFDAKKYKLKAGDRVEYWAVAVDNKQPDPNVSETRRYALRIAAKDEQPQQDQLADARQPPKDGQKNAPSDKPEHAPPPAARQQDQQQQRREQDQRQSGGQPQANQPQDQQPQPGDRPEEQNPGQQGNGAAGQDRQPGQDRNDRVPGQADQRRVDPDADPGQAIEKINEHFDKKKDDEQPTNGGKQQNGSGERNGEKGQSKPPEAGRGSQHEEPMGGSQQSGTESRPVDRAPGKGGDEPQQSAGKQSEPPQPPSHQKQDQANAGDEGPKNSGQKSGQKQETDAQASDGGSNAPAEAGNDKSAEGGNDKTAEGGNNKTAGKQPGGDSQSQEAGAPQPNDNRGQSPSAGKEQNREQSSEKSAGAEQGRAADGGKSSTKESTPPSGTQGEQGANGKQNTGTEKNTGTEQNTGGEQGKQSGARSQSGDKQGMPQGGDQPRPDEPGQSGAKPQSGDGGKADAAIGDKNQPGDKPAEQQTKANGTEGENANTAQSSDGAGKSGDDKKANPAAQQENRPRDKQPSNEGSSDAKRDGSDATSPARDKTDSQTQGDSSGDVKGAGQDGGGQRASKPGTGGPGENTAADEGGGRSNEKGAGETSGRAGDQAKGNAQQAEGRGQKDENTAGDQKAADRGTSSKTGGEPQKSKGNDPQPSEGNTQPRNAANEQPSAADQARQNPDQQPSGGNQGTNNRPGPSKPGERSNALTGRGNPTAGGPTNGTNEPIHEEQAREPGGEDPNLAYARKATDLAIERLKDQMKKGDPDQELLDQLKWSKDDLKRFVDRWERMKQAAAEPGDAGRAARQELDNTLRNLGLRPHGTALGANAANDDQTRAMRQTRRTAPPAEYADQYRAYTTGTGKAKQ